MSIDNPGDDLISIAVRLVKNPGYLYMNASLTRAYILTEEGVLICFVHDFTGMSEVDVNLHIQKSIAAKFN